MPGMRARRPALVTGWLFDALLRALRAGARTTRELLDAAWSEVPDQLRPAAAVTLAAHLDKLDGEGRLPTGVERPQLPSLSGVG